MRITSLKKKTTIYISNSRSSSLLLPYKQLFITLVQALELENSRQLQGGTNQLCEKSNCILVQTFGCGARFQPPGQNVVQESLQKRDGRTSETFIQILSKERVLSYLEPPFWSGTDMSQTGSLLTLCESVEALGFSPLHWIPDDPMLSHGIRCQGPRAEKPRAVRVGGVNTRPTTMLTPCRSSQGDSPDAQCGRQPSPNIIPGLCFPGRLPSPGLCLDLWETSVK